MILPMYIFGQPVLRKHAEDIPTDYEGLQDLIDNMFETLKNAEGVGLAAPQVGLPIRVVVVDLDCISDDEPQYKGFLRTYGLRGRLPFGSRHPREGTPSPACTHPIPRPRTPTPRRVG